MPLDFLNEFAEENMPEIFAEIGTETVNIIRATRTADGFGGELSTDETIYENIPALREPHLNGNPRYENGGVWTSDKFTLPAYFENEALDLKITDKLLRQADGQNEAIKEQTFSIVEIRNLSVLLEVVCVRDAANS